MKCFKAYELSLLLYHVAITTYLTSVFVVNIRVDRVCPLNFNPADFCIQQLAIVPGLEIECRQFIQVSATVRSIDRVQRFCDACHQFAFCVHNNITVDLVTSEIFFKSDKRNYNLH